MRKPPKTNISLKPLTWGCSLPRVLPNRLYNSTGTTCRETENLILNPLLIWHDLTPAPVARTVRFWGTACIVRGAAVRASCAFNGAFLAASSPLRTASRSQLRRETKGPTSLGAHQLQKSNERSEGPNQKCSPFRPFPASKPSCSTIVFKTLHYSYWDTLGHKIVGGK